VGVTEELLRPQGFSSSEVSARFGCTQPKVQCLVQHVRDRLRRLEAQSL
jgi:hypothetical protein